MNHQLTLQAGLLLQCFHSQDWYAHFLLELAATAGALLRLRLPFADALEAADALLAGGCSPAKTAAHVATLHTVAQRGDAATQAAVRGALAADLAPLAMLLSGLICGKKVQWGFSHPLMSSSGTQGGWRLQTAVHFEAGHCIQSKYSNCAGKCRSTTM